MLESKHHESLLKICFKSEFSFFFTATSIKAYLLVKEIKVCTYNDL